MGLVKLKAFDERDRWGNRINFSTYGKVDIFHLLYTFL